MKKITQSEFDLRCKAKNVRCLDPYVHGKSYVRFSCLSCRHVWSAVAGTLRLSGCPACANVNRQSAHVYTADQVQSRLPNDITLIGAYTGMLRKTEFRHECGHVWSATPGNVLAGRGCPACKNKLKWSSVVKGHVRGYEPQALDYIVKNKLAKPKDIVWDIKDERMPKIPYVHAKKRRTYHPDFYITQDKRIVEVKSVGTLGIKHRGTFFKSNSLSLFTTLKAKRRACVEQGYKFTLMLMNADGTRIALPKNWHTMTLNQLRASI